MSAVKFFEHPEYFKAKANWQLLRDLYEGDHDTMVGPDYLVKHVLETKTDGAALYTVRQAATKYFNIVEILTSIWVTSVLRNQPKIPDSLDAMLNSAGIDEAKDIDGFGTSLYALMKFDALLNMVLYGKALLLVDAPAVKPQSKGQVTSGKIRPWIWSLHPLAVKDWEIETEDTARFGKLNKLRWEYEFVPPRARLDQIPMIETRCDVLEVVNNRYQSTTYTLSGAARPYNSAAVVISDQSGWEQVDETTLTELTELPIAVYDDESWLKDAAQESLRFHNLRSGLDSINLAQGYQKVFAFLEDKTPAAIKALGEYVVGILGQQDSVTAIPPVPSGDLLSLCNSSLELAFKMGLNQLRSLPVSSKETQAADAQAEAKEEQRALRQTLGQDLQDLVNRALDFYAQFKGQTLEEGVTIIENEEEATFQDQVVVYNALVDVMGDLPTLKSAAVSRMARIFDLDEEQQIDFQAELEVLRNKPKPVEGQGDIISQAMGLGGQSKPAS